MAESTASGEATIAALMAEAQQEASQQRVTELFPPGTPGPLTPGGPGRSDT